MGLFQVAKCFHNTPLEDMVFKFLRREYNATIQSPTKEGRTYLYKIEGDEIPEGDKLFTIIIREDFPKVYSITIQ